MQYVHFTCTAKAFEQIVLWQLIHHKEHSHTHSKQTHQSRKTDVLQNNLQESDSSSWSQRSRCLQNKNSPGLTQTDWLELHAPSFQVYLSSASETCQRSLSQYSQTAGLVLFTGAITSSSIKVHNGYKKCDTEYEH